MIKFDWDNDIYGVNGTKYSRREIENWFVGEVEDKIRKRLNKRINAQYNYLSPTISPKTIGKRKILEIIVKDLSLILLARPEELLHIWHRIVYSGYRAITSLGIKLPYDLLDKTFLDEILDDFNYKGFREKLLPQLNSRLNIKSCPYCNQHFTLNITQKTIPENSDGRMKYEELAKFQFDHFYDKSTYPILSMSLYNLVPSCAVCNLRKGTRKLPLIFHPYYTEKEICVRFASASPIPALTGGKPEEPDEIPIRLYAEDPANENDLRIFKETFQLEERYARHRDVMEEVMAREYLQVYYSERSNFAELLGLTQNPRAGGVVGTLDRELYNRVIAGNYTEEGDFHRRPLSKFMSDLRNRR